MAVGEKGWRGWFHRLGQRGLALILILALGLVLASETFAALGTRLGNQYPVVPGAGEEVALASFNRPSQSGGAWQQINTPSSPGNRGGYSLVVIDNVAYLFGGYTAAGFQNDLWQFDSLTGIWTQVIPSTKENPSGRADYAAAGMAGKLVIQGGTDGTNNLDDLWIFDPVTQMWTQKTPPGPAPPPLQLHKAVVSNNQMYLVGGIAIDGQPSDQLWAYDPTANSWAEKAAYPGPSGGAYGAAVFAPGSNIMVGGTTGDDYYVYNPGTNSWEAKTATNFPNRESPGTVQVGATGYIFGGQDTATAELSTESWEADLSGGTTVWEPLPPDMPSAKADICLIPEAHSPTAPIWPRASVGAEVGTTEGQPGVLLYGRSWAYDPENPLPIPVWGDAATWIYWPNASAAGALEGIVVWPRNVTLEMAEPQAFSANGYDGYGLYVPISPTWEATGGSVTAFGLYTAGDLPGIYQVRAEDGALADAAQVTISGAKPCPDLDPGESWSHVFVQPGVYPYHDRANSDHTGTVVVSPTLAAWNPSGTTWDVSITAGGFDPPIVTISLSDTVRWTNNDTTIHAVNGGAPAHFVYLPIALRQTP
jgi:plastocyanin/N-acetylneuraminic acid mutarotase